MHCVHRPVEKPTHEGWYFLQGLAKGFHKGTATVSIATDYYNSTPARAQTTLARRL